MRKGQNPAKLGTMPAYQAYPLGIASIVYIPEQIGYFKDALEIFKIHLSSVHQYTSDPFDYLVFDNGSCPEVKEELMKLHQDGWIDWVILSKANLGKTGALNFLINAMPNEWICYADSDMLFRPGWLEASWKINETFSGCGMIGSQVIFPDWEVDKGNTLFRKTIDPRYRFDQVCAQDWVITEYCRARGISEEKQHLFSEMLLDKVTCFENGVEAFLGGNSHQQWLARKDIIQKILPLPATQKLNRKEDTYQDQRLDELGYLHLTTTIPYLYHMGNTIDEEILPEVQKLSNLQIEKRQQSEKENRKQSLLWKALVWLSHHKRSQRLLLRLYDNLYQVFSN